MKSFTIAQIAAQQGMKASAIKGLYTKGYRYVIYGGKLSGNPLFSKTLKNATSVVKDYGKGVLVAKVKKPETSGQAAKGRKASKPSGRRAASDFDSFKKLVNKLRRDNKNGWYTWTGNVAGKSVRLKGYNTWLQKFEVNGLDYSGPADISVKRFNEVLAAPFAGRRAPSGRRAGKLPLSVDKAADGSGTVWLRRDGKTWDAIADFSHVRRGEYKGIMVYGPNKGKKIKAASEAGLKKAVASHLRKRSN